jgi:predicted nucleotidyltransferase
MARILTPQAVGALVGVKPVTIRKWASAGRIPCDVLPSGHRRFDADEVREALGASAPGGQDAIAQLIRAELRRWPLPPLSATIFGSFARNEESAVSDVDVLFVFAQAAETRSLEVLRGMVRLRRLLSERIGRELDPFVLSSEDLTRTLPTNGSFFAAVLLEGVDAGDTAVADLIAARYGEMVARDRESKTA